MGKAFSIGGTEFEFNEYQVDMLNELASRFYQDFGYVGLDNFDFSSSQHPMERKMFILAVHAYEFHMEVGFD